MELHLNVLGHEGKHAGDDEGAEAARGHEGHVDGVTQQPTYSPEQV